MNRFILVLALLFALPVYAETPEQLAADCLNIGTYAAQGDKFYKQHNYSKARELYKEQVAWSETCELDAAKIATAYNNVALTYIHEKDYLKARAWLSIRPEDKKSIYNLSLIKDKFPSDNASSPILPEGEYWSYVGKAVWNNIAIKKNNENYNIVFEGLYPGPMFVYYGPNLGEFSVSLAIKNNRAIYVMHDQDPSLDCVYNFSFARNYLSLNRISGDSCGFGQHVSAEGRYFKVVQY